MQLSNIDKAHDIIDMYEDAKIMHETIADLEHRRNEAKDVHNESTYVVQIVVYPTDSRALAVKLDLQTREHEEAIIKVIKDAYEYHKKQVQEL